MSNLTFKRGQVEWAIWNWTLAGRPGSAEMPARLKARINKLLELDRRDASLTSAKAQSQYAFLEKPPSGTGTDLELTAFDTFCLALGCNMLEFGFKQSEVVLLFRQIRTSLRPKFDQALAQPPSRQRYFAHHFPDKPKNPRDPRFAEMSMFMVQERIETADMVEEGTTLLREPDFYDGHSELAQHFEHFGMSQRRQAYVVEIAHTAFWISHALQQAPIIKRGRRA